MSHKKHDVLNMFKFKISQTVKFIKHKNTQQQTFNYAFFQQ